MGDVVERRTSGLKAPVLLLTGHEGEVYCVEFSSDGQLLASGGKDKNVFLFEVYGECRNIGVLSGHKNAILELHWGANGENLYCCSADHCASLWDVEYQRRLIKYVGHTGIVNSCYPARSVVGGMLVTGADDGTVKVWDHRSKRPVKSLEHDFQILSVCCEPSGERFFCGSLDNTIRVYDNRSDKELFKLEGCTDSVTSLDLNHDGTLLLSNSMDSRLVVWDVQPFCTESSRVKTALFGPTHSAEKNLIRARWGNGTIISSGSADRFVYILDTKDNKLLYQLPGHLGSVNEVVLHPTEPIVASASSDKCVYLGELL
ncbi:u5 snRNP-specific 40 kDa protein, putative [Babesia bigemina]|uniref:U5 snRNP-specific 40 kDa protein, putative n=1 Tax=Babesia bigemina TaxID=5866 RepID=A0A061D5E6_BABBI|nr:u5 snRNP-specific 40 kDa protein, putative [Babesia bigemina]CDR95257.1 u5 snRNP-specific 40 kDa protein, putative [Babesia bigemina]|eukprot:XP_012767443.1 u5 snRNP-specific 40 kDa protein, putative [Babesia bigemina]